MTQSKNENVVLPAIVFDTLHLASLAFGGLTTGRFCGSIPGTYEYDLNCPNCAHGLLMAAEGIREPYMPRSLSKRLRDAGISGGSSDNAIRTIRYRRRDYTSRTRVSFEDWCSENRIVRGD